MRLIDRDALIECKFKNPISYNAFVNLVKRQPTIDAVEVVHGKWIIYPISDGMNQCSKCGVLRFGESNYCPNCGAKMDGERRDQ